MPKVGKAGSFVSTAEWPCVPPSSHTFQGGKGSKCMTHWVFTCLLPAPPPSKTCLSWVDAALPHWERLRFCLPPRVFACPRCSLALLQLLSGDSKSLPPLGTVSDAVGISVPPLSKPGEMHRPCCTGLRGWGAPPQKTTDGRER